MRYTIENKFYKPDIIKITKEKKEIILNRQNNLCLGCKEEITTLFEIDHILPISKGGNNELDNLQALCRSCHISKTRDEKQIVSISLNINICQVLALNHIILLWDNTAQN
jgi:5-methylcytosine-specific restriction endonuclease McrA